MAHSVHIGKKVLLYFVKYPEPGRVKTRLATVLGDETAARVYRRLAETNLKALDPLREAGVHIVVAYDPPDLQPQVKSWLSGDYDYLPQRGNGLGERLASAFGSAFEAGAENVVAVGSDTLGLRAEIIRQSYDALSHGDLVLGPAKDGGYYLIGLTGYVPGLFRDIPWSTSGVLDATLARAREHGLRCHLLQELEDLDEISNMRRREFT